MDLWQSEEHLLNKKCKARQMLKKKKRKMSFLPTAEIFLMAPPKWKLSLRIFLTINKYLLHVLSKFKIIISIMYEIMLNYWTLISRQRHLFKVNPTWAGGGEGYCFEIFRQLINIYLTLWNYAQLFNTGVKTW